MSYRAKVLAVIPARAGSKRLPGKNVMNLGGIPLIAWSIRSALAANVFDQVLVSTDDPTTAKIAIDHGAVAPWLRPKELSTDGASSVDVVLHALSAYESAGIMTDSVMLLQPTSPFRSAQTIQRAISLHQEAGNVPVVSMCPAKAHPAWCFAVDATGHMRPYVGGGAVPTRSQDLPAAYQLNGAIYLATVGHLRRERSFLCSHTRALIVAGPEESIDIDDAWDWRLAECIANGSFSNGEVT